MNAQIIYTVNTVEAVIMSILSTIFCLLELFVLLYTKRTKLFVHVPTVTDGRNMHAT